MSLNEHVEPLYIKWMHLNEYDEPLILGQLDLTMSLNGSASGKSMGMKDGSWYLQQYFCVKVVSLKVVSPREPLYWMGDLEPISTEVST